jgi:peptide/nickel transport system permease protein
VATVDSIVVSPQEQLRRERRRRIRERRRKRARDSWYLIRTNPMTMTGFVIVIALIVMAIFAPLVAPYNPNVFDLNHIQQGPSWSHLFGTDQQGRDVFSRVVYGARVSLRIAVIAVGCIAAIGIPLGLIAGTFGGWVDSLIMRLADVFLAFPTLALALAVAATLGGGVQNVIIALAVAGWAWYARLLRGVVLTVRHEAYIEAAQVSGASWPRIMRRSILPNSFAPMLVQMSQDMGFAILLTASLGFLGIGVQIPTPEWGTMINDGYEIFMNAWWVATFPGLAIILAVLGFNLLGDGIRDILDPRTRR